MNKSQIILQALEYLMDYKAKLYAASDGDESNLEALSNDFFYCDALQRTIYFLTKIYYQLKGE